MSISEKRISFKANRRANNKRFIVHVAKRVSEFRSFKSGRGRRVGDTEKTKYQNGDSHGGGKKDGPCGFKKIKNK